MTFEEEIIQDFLNESKDYLTETEAAFIKISDGDTDPDTFNGIFRLVHNLKGSAAAVGLTTFADFCHKVEEILTAVKEGEMELDLKLAFFLLKCNDVLKEYIDLLLDDHTSVLDTTEIESEIRVIVDAKSGPAATESVVDQANDTAPEQTKETSETTEEVVAEQSEEKQVDSENAKSAETSDTAPAESEQAKVASETPLQEEKKPAEASQAPKKRPTRKAEFLRVESTKLDNLLNYVGELVVNQAIIGNHNKNETLHLPQAKHVIRYMGKLISDLRDISLSLRMTPVQSVFQKMHRIIKELSVEQSKTINFITKGEEVELDKTVVERIADPLVHLIRNAVDHGIEASDARKERGKPEVATVELSAEQQEDYVVIRIADDGKGLDREAIRGKAIQKGIIKESDQLSDEEINGLIFRSGFSTKEQISAVSGRGVGMDVVARAIEDLKGTIAITSQQGIGTTFTISLPLSLSIIQGMVIKINDDKFIVPLSQLVETLDYSRVKEKSMTLNGPVINLRGDVIPVYSISSLLAEPMLEKTSHKDSDKLLKGILTEYLGRKISFEVDEIIGQQEVVIKKLGDEMQGIPGIFAGAILEDGDPGLILNLHDYLKQRGHYDIAA